ncbi:MAG: hypothetical protein IME97_04140, partial [Proteobacteria bacterium]|nr:hypothetical protein [Pseudomonadota bacterium]
MEKLFNRGTGLLRMTILIASLVMSMVLSGCASTGANRGMLERNRDLERTLLSYEVIPDHRYYTSGGY